MGEAFEAFEEDPQFQGVDMSQMTVFNPANGLPMVGGIAGQDVLGNTYGFDHQQG